LRNLRIFWIRKSERVNFIHYIPPLSKMTRNPGRHPRSGFFVIADHFFVSFVDMALKVLSISAGSVVGKLHLKSVQT